MSGCASGRGERFLQNRDDEVSRRVCILVRYITEYKVYITIDKHPASRPSHIIIDRRHLPFRFLSRPSQIYTLALIASSCRYQGRMDEESQRQSQPLSIESVIICIAHKRTGTFFNDISSNASALEPLRIFDTLCRNILIEKFSFNVLSERRKKTRTADAPE